MDRVSKSSLNTFLQCQRKFYYSLLGTELEKTSPEMQYGTDFHKLLENYNNKMIKGDFQKEIKVDKEFLPTFNKYVEILGSLEKEGFKIISSEFPIGAEGFFGFIDALFYDEKEKKYLILDFKTLTSSAYDKANIEKYRLEINFYIYLLSHFKNADYRNILGGVVIFEQKGERAELKYINNDIDKYYSNIDEAKVMLEKLNKADGSPDEFPKVSEDKTDYACRYCSFYNMCR